MISFKYLDAVISSEGLWELTVEETKRHLTKMKVVFWVGIIVNTALVACFASKIAELQLLSFLSFIIDGVCIIYCLVKIRKQH